MILTGILINNISLYSQETNNLRKDWMENHSTQRATLYSAVLPGLGQAYNHQYWKIPIVYAGIAAIIYSIDYNTRKYYAYRNAYYNLSNETGDESYKELPAYPPDSYGYKREDVLFIFEKNRDKFRRYREISILSGIGFYLLNIIEANISAHFLYFDISDNLALRMQPLINISANSLERNIGLQFSLNLN